MKSDLNNGNARVRTLKGTALTPELIAAWNEILRENDELSSPFFSPQYTAAVSAFVPQTEIGVMEVEGKPLAFLAYEKGRHGIATRVRLSDYEGFVAPKGLRLDAAAFVKGCGLAAWDFNHLLAQQSPLKSFHQIQTTSPIMDLSQGFDRYLEERKQSGRMELIKRCGSKMRKLEREAGELRFEIHVEDKAILETLLKWRQAKYGSRQPFELLTGVLGKLLSEQTDTLRGTLSVLYAKGEVVAGHFGLRSKNTWHWWFPAYNPQFDKCSPGLILILKMAEHAAKAGVQILDFGKGDQDYKLHLMNSSIPLAEGSVEASTVLSFARALKKGAKNCLRRAPRLDRMLRGVASANNIQ